MKYLVGFLKKRKFMLAGALFLLIGQVVGTLLVPYLVADLIDLGIVKGDLFAIWQIGLQMLLVTLIATVVAIGGCYLSADLAASYGRDMREAIFRKTQALSIKDFDHFGTSSLITRTTSDIALVQQGVVMILQMIIPAPLMIATSIVMTWLVKPELTLIPIVAIGAFLLIGIIVMKKSASLSGAMQVRMDKIIQVVRESIVGIRVIRAFDNGNYEKKRSDGAFEDYAGTIISINRLFAILNPMVWLVMGLSMAAIVWFGGLFAADGAIAIGQITAVVEYTVVTLGYLIMAIFVATTLPKMLACLRRLSQVLDTAPEIMDGASGVGVNGVTKVAFDDVTFSYHGAEMPVLQNISFCCEAGQTTALIGGTGSGKTTVADVLLRLHDLDSGQIRLDGTDIRTLTQNDLRAQIGYVPQKAFLFSGTIRDNLLMGNPNATPDDLRRAIQIAQAEPFIDSLPLGFESMVAQGGANFSGGQKQRLAIARALCKNAPILVFDDSFSALDYKTDVALRKALKQAVPNTVMIIIAQRISTILDADQIIVLDEGQIVGKGRHENLLKTCPIYQEIARSQSMGKENETL